MDSGLEHSQTAASKVFGQVEPQAPAGGTTAHTPPPLMRKRSSRMWAVEADGERSPSWSPSPRSSSSWLSASSPTSFRRTASQSEAVSNAHTRRTSVWDESMSSDTSLNSPLSPLAAIRRNMTESTLEEETEDVVRRPDIDSDDSEDELARREAHIIVQTFDSEEAQNAGSALAALKGWTSFSADDSEDQERWENQSRSAHKWRWFILAIVHLRFADCAEQQEDIVHAESFACMTNLNTTPYSAVQSKKVSRRATLFGTIIGTYRTSIDEGIVRLTHCLGDEVTDISQALRVRKSNTRHRIERKPLLYFDHIRPKQPRRLPLPSNALEEDSLLSALQLHASNREIEKQGALYDKQRIKDQAPPMAVVDDIDESLSPLSLDSAGKERASSSRRPIVGANPHQRRRRTAQFMRSELELAAHVAHMEALQEEMRLMRLFQKKSRVHETVEFFAPRNTDLWDTLRQHYDRDQMAHVTNHHYSPLNLLKRDALRFDPRIQYLLHTIYQATDVDDSGGIDRDEYDEMHSKLTCALLGREVSGDSTVRFYMSNLDWQVDCKGFNTLNKQRLEDCYFTMADRFTSGTDIDEYVAFLNRLLTRVVEFDPETGEVGLRSEEDIWDLGEADPLVENNEFRLQSKRQREATKKKSRKKKTIEVQKKERFYLRTPFAVPQKRSTFELNVHNALEEDPLLSYGVLSKILRREGFNEQTLPKYTIVFDFEPGDEDRKLTVKKGDIVYECPPPLERAIGPPPDADGWTLTLQVCDGEDVFGWCPDTVMLYLARGIELPLPPIDKVEEPLPEEIPASNDVKSKPPTPRNDEPVGNNKDMVEKMDQAVGTAIVDEAKVEEEMSEGVERSNTEKSDDKQIVKQAPGIRAVVSAKQTAAGHMQSTRTKNTFDDDGAQPLRDVQVMQFGSSGFGARAQTPPPQEPQPPVNFERRLVRQTRIGGGSLRFPGFSSEPVPKLSERTSGPHLTSSERARFSQSLPPEMTSSFSRMGGSIIPPAKPTPDMVAEAARLYMARCKDIPKFVHHGQSNSAARAQTSHSTRESRKELKIVQFGSVGNVSPAQSHSLHGGEEQQSLQSDGVRIIKRTEEKLPRIHKPRFHAEVRSDPRLDLSAQTAAVPVQPMFSTRPSTGLQTSAARSVPLPPHMRGRSAHGFRSIT